MISLAISAFHAIPAIRAIRPATSDLVPPSFQSTPVVLCALVIAITWLGALVVIVVGSGGRRPRWQGMLAAGSALAACVPALMLLFTGPAPASAALASSVGVFDALSLRPDGLGIFLTLIATLIGALTIIFSMAYMRGEAQLGRYYALALLFIGAMVGLVTTDSLLWLIVFWEMVAFCSYALIAFHNDDPKAVAGGLRALVVTQLGSIGLIVGAIAAVGMTGSIRISDLLAVADHLPPATLALIAFGFLAAAAAKSAQVPFHTWLPGAMEAPTPISALIHAATMVNAGVFLIVRFYPAFAAVPGWADAVLVIGVMSAALGGLMALVSTDLKRVLAYSTVSQLGTMFYAVGIGGLFISQFYLLSHAIFKALLFLAAGAVIHAVGTRDMRLMGGLGRSLPITRTVFIIGALGLAGVPIFNGFWSKELLLEAGLKHGPALAYAVMLAAAALTALYTARMTRLVFYGAPRGVQPAHDAPPIMLTALIPLAIATCGSWLLVGGLADMLRPALGAAEPPTPADLISEIVKTPGTLIGLVAITAGALLWAARARLAGAIQWLQPVADAARHDFGFMGINRAVAAAVRWIAGRLSRTQTGQLNWNVAGIVLGLIVVGVVLALSGIP